MLTFVAEVAVPPTSFEALLAHIDEDAATGDLSIATVQLGFAKDWNDASPTQKLKKGDVLARIGDDALPHRAGGFQCLHHEEALSRTWAGASGCN